MARLKCPDCPNEVVEGDLVCGNCGNLFVGAVQPVPMPESSPEPEPESGFRHEPEPRRLPEPAGEAGPAGPAPDPEPLRTGAAPLPTTVDRAGVLELRFPGGSIVVRSGREVVLGRDPQLCPVAATRLAEYDNVSRRHATVGLDPDGTCWVRDEGSVNGTFVDGRELEPGERGALHDGARLRLASDVVAHVRRMPDGPGGGG
ncbi:hypothetical protein RKD27_007496 [Streptomyces sp. SAI-126]|uniref:FHA domain-containing protein n=1 Tax=Streptomyces sp. SAI-126 TaxID=3377732 RepID=UPI003C7AEF00